MDKYLLKRPPSAPVTIPSKKSKPSARQGTVTALQRVNAYGKDQFYYNEGILFARIATW